MEDRRKYNGGNKNAGRKPKADEEKVKTAMAQGLRRLISTLGHDGKITYIRENLLTIDFGIERGITRGQQLIAGYVLLSSFHPQTGEFLRAEYFSTKNNHFLH